MLVSRLHRGRPRRSVGHRAANVFVCLITVLLGLGDAGTANAHTGFESSTPAEGSVIDEPVEVVSIAFTGEATPVGDEFVALTAEGVLQQPVSVETADDKLFTLRFEPPLTGGQVGIRWNVQAADAHPIEGAFAFTVNAIATPPTSAPPTTAQAATTEPATAVTSPVTEPSVAASAQDPPFAPDAGLDESQARSLEEFLTVDEATPGETTATLGRVIGLLGVALGLGGFAFVATVLRGPRLEIRRGLTAVRVWSGVIVFGSIVEYIGISRIAGESLASAWSSAPGFATVLRVVGGLGLIVGLGGTMSRGRVQRLTRPSSVARSLSAAVTEDISDGSTSIAEETAIYRWTPNGSCWPATGGAALIIASFWFDGHTVSKGFRPLHALVNSVHVAAGAVWVGGVVAMATLVWARRTSGRPMRTVELVVRFSKIATVALVAVVAAGGIMAFLILDSFGELTATPWGRILLLKTGAVGLAVIGGAYNHFRLLPALESDPESPELLDELRSTITAEAIMLVFVVVVTAWLVAAAS